MLRSLLANHMNNLERLRALTHDLDHKQACTQPMPGMNHPAWIVGHLAVVADRATAVRLLGQSPALPDEWAALFGKGSEPLADPDAYPDLVELIAAVAERHATIAELISVAGVTLFEKATPDEHFRKRFSTLGGALLFTTVTHEALHLGQLSAWRRASGLPATS